MVNGVVNQQTLLFDLLRATYQNQEVYPLLQQNLDKLNHNFVLLLQQWVSEQFTKEPRSAINIARIIVKFSNLIQQFEQGNVEKNIEIAIAGYEIVLQVITYEAFPKEWDSIQQALSSAYQQRHKILSTTVAEIKQNTVQTQTQMNILAEQFQQELEQAKLQVNELKNQQILQQLQQTRQEVDELRIALSRLEPVESSSGSPINLQPIVSTIFEKISPGENFNTVILYDIENLTKGNKKPTFEFSLEKIIQQVKQTSIVEKIAIQCAYADWSNNRLGILKKDIQKLGIQPIQIFGFSYQRNAADIQLTIDAIELLHSRPSLQVFVIVSGDGAFAYLAQKLHEYAKTVIGCAYTNQTNEVLAAVCDEFIWLPNPGGESGKETVNLLEQTTPTKSEAIITDEQAVLYYLKTNESYCHLSRQDGVDIGHVKQVFTQMIPGFDHKQQGFKKFKDYLNSVCQGTEFETVFQNGNQNRIVLKLREESNNKVYSK